MPSERTVSSGLAGRQPEPLARPQAEEGPARGLDLLFVNPPSPDGDTWIRCQHRAGQRAPDGTVWPQTALAQLAALFPDFQVSILDASARSWSWERFAGEVSRLQPRWYVTQVAGPTLSNDLRGLALAKQAGAATVVFGPIVTPVARELLQRFPGLDYVVCGEPEVTLRELIEVAGADDREMPPVIAAACSGAGDGGRPKTLGAIRGLAWRHGDEVVVNPQRPLIAQLDDLPLPAHRLLPLGAYRAPTIQAPAAMVVTSRGCPGRCSFCLKHVTYRDAVRLRSPEHIVEELLLLRRLGARHVYMQADSFTVCRDQVADLCRLMIAEGVRLSWSCSARVDLVDERLLALMGQAGCQRITWAIESGNDVLLWRIGRGTRADEVPRAVAWASAAGIRSWGSFILGLPGETEETIQQTIALSKGLSLERVSFELAVPRPGTPFWEQAGVGQWLVPGARWEDADVCGPAIVSYPWLTSARLEFSLERAYREWALRPGSLWGRLPQLAPSRGAASLFVQRP